MKRFSSIGLFGLGAFGRLMVRHLAPYFAITAHDPSPHARAFAKRHNITLGTLEETAKQPIILIATPIRAMKPLIAEIAPHVRPHALVIDVGSVKVKPATWLLNALPANVDIVCTHPLFGPQSAKDGIIGLEIVVCPVRARHTKHLERFLRDSLSLKVSVTSPAAHDEALAAVQGLTHLIAKVLSGLEPLPRHYTTRSYEKMIEGISMVTGDSDELFLAIERDNPFAQDLRRRFFAEIDSLRERLEGQDHEA